MLGHPRCGAMMPSVVGLLQGTPASSLMVSDTFSWHLEALLQQWEHKMMEPASSAVDAVCNPRAL